ncbi:MAG TPA: AAA family ATPase [Nitrospira sp.]|nr:AAA family ATPase [Nitrospira sp.]
MVELTGQQAKAADEVAAWYVDAHGYGGSKTLGGYAGTGKTTMLGELPRILPPRTRIVYASFTGKAVSVLRSKLPRGSEVSTLHRLLYHPRQKMICIESGEDVLLLNGRCETHYDRTWQEELGHEFNEHRPCEVRRALDWSPVVDPLEDIDLVVVDEASMVSEKIWADLTKWGVPVLAVGDHGQLPPVKSEFNLMANPQIRLETVLRQAAGSPIIKMATLARTTGRIPIADYGPGCVKLPPYKQAQALTHLRPERGDLVLCSFNRTRNLLNTRLRKRVVDPPDGDPVVGDIVICLRNSYEAGVFNGMRGRITALGPVADWFEHPQRFAAVQLLDEDYEFEGEVATEQFNQPKTLNEIKRSATLWDYGYAMTVHKSQGSQADRVLVIEERFPRDDDEFHARLLYTAVTRAVRSLCVVGPA